MSSDLFRELTAVEELEREAKLLARCKDNFVYKRPVGISVFFREPIATARAENKKELEKAREAEKQEKSTPNQRHTAAVVVLGDIGRSPRMCYHAYSLATQLDYNVKLVGYLDSVPHPMVHNNPYIK
ncbi:unnamed protein product [Strongylus vulgaris]|uniref:Glycosyl transferase family 1 domain-containing protein n=1 Tax=Strongylus vulgaris TaxID=40348 RepID=A0A3P7K9X5_STRVU|nr:unnamed protein product [Strongylus vulgaris]